MVDSERLHWAMKKRNLKRQYVADKIGISPSSLYNKLYGIKEFNASEIMKLSKLLGLTKDQRDEIFFKEERGKTE